MKGVNQFTDVITKTRRRLELLQCALHDTNLVKFPFSSSSTYQVSTLILAASAAVLSENTEKKKQDKRGILGGLGGGYGGGAALSSGSLGYSGIGLGSVPVSVPKPYPVSVPRPYPVSVPHPVPVNVPQPYPVNVPQPYPVTAGSVSRMSSPPPPPDCNVACWEERRGEGNTESFEALRLRSPRISITNLFLLEVDSVDIISSLGFVVPIEAQYGECLIMGVRGGMKLPPRAPRGFGGQTDISRTQGGGRGRERKSQRWKQRVYRPVKVNTVRFEGEISIKLAGGSLQISIHTEDQLIVHFTKLAMKFFLVSCITLAAATAVLGGAPQEKKKQDKRGLLVAVPQPYPVSVPRPYPVSVPHPVPVSVPKPYPVSVPRPYPVSVPHPVPVNVPQPYPVNVPQPYPVTFTRPRFKPRYSPSSAVELNTTSALANYATELALRGSVPTFALKVSGETTKEKSLNNLNLTILSSIVFCESDALDQASTEEDVVVVASLVARPESLVADKAIFRAIKLATPPRVYIHSNGALHTKRYFLCGQNRIVAEKCLCLHFKTARSWWYDWWQEKNGHATKRSATSLFGGAVMVAPCVRAQLRSVFSISSSLFSRYVASLTWLGYYRGEGEEKGHFCLKEVCWDEKERLAT
uniref:Uncharacterized protein n=1 Tax=Timema shepardi TaxID=629360 RepID=A0A7R9FWZ3_TIMSH|nr:unnamed protein product [Timema shepardi]